jgi:uncharacterized protein
MSDAPSTSPDWPRPVSAPAVSAETRVYWEAAREDRLLIKRCTKCREAFHFPRAHCPFCFNAETVWEEASGKGEIYTFSIVRRSPTGPYVLAYVELAEGPRMFTNIVRAGPDALRIGQAVQVVFQPADGGWKIPMFEPAQSPVR